MDVSEKTLNSGFPVVLSLGNCFLGHNQSAGLSAHDDAPTAGFLTSSDPSRRAIASYEKIVSKGQSRLTAPDRSYRLIKDFG
jgi:hypothetical protein